MQSTGIAINCVENGLERSRSDVPCRLQKELLEEVGERRLGFVPMVATAVAPAATFFFTCYPPRREDRRTARERRNRRGVVWRVPQNRKNLSVSLRAEPLVDVHFRVGVIGNAAVGPKARAHGEGGFGGNVAGLPTLIVLPPVLLVPCPIDQGGLGRERVDAPQR